MQQETKGTSPKLREKKQSGTGMDLRFQEHFNVNIHDVVLLTQLRNLLVILLKLSFLPQYP